MRLQFGTSAIKAAGRPAALALSAARAHDEFQGNVPSSGADRLLETAWTGGMRMFLSPRPQQLAGVALTSTGELQAVFACSGSDRRLHLDVEQASFSASGIHVPGTTLPSAMIRADASVRGCFGVFISSA
jgi:hypothetical protein